MTGFKLQPCTGPCFYSGTFPVETVGDTYLNTTLLGKGTVWVNGISGTLLGVLAPWAA